MATGRADELAADFTEPLLELTAVPRRVAFAHTSGGKDEFVAKGWRDRATGFEERFEMHFGRLLEAQNRFAPVTSVRMTTGEQLASGDVHAVFVAADFDLRDRNEHLAKVAAVEGRVKRLLGAEGTKYMEGGAPAAGTARKNGL